MESENQTLSGEFTLTPTPPSPSVESPPVEQSSTAPTSSPFLSHFIQNPRNFTFQSQETSEQIVLVLRSHMIVNTPWVALTIILILVPLSLFLMAGSFSIIKLDILTKMLILGAYYLIVFGYAFLNFTLWYFQTAIITTKKIIDINLNGILSLQINEAPLESVLDISYSQKGLIASFFDYGDISLETETRVQDLEIPKAPHPARAVDIISKLVAAKGGRI